MFKSVIDDKFINDKDDALDYESEAYSDEDSIHVEDDDRVESVVDEEAMYEDMFNVSKYDPVFDSVVSNRQARKIKSKSGGNSRNGNKNKKKVRISNKNDFKGAVKETKQELKESINKFSREIATNELDGHFSKEDIFVNPNEKELMNLISNWTKESGSQLIFTGGRVTNLYSSIKRESNDFDFVFNNEYYWDIFINFIKKLPKNDWRVRLDKISKTTFRIFLWPAKSNDEFQLDVTYNVLYKVPSSFIPLSDDNLYIQSPEIALAEKMVANMEWIARYKKSDRKWTQGYYYKGHCKYIVDSYRLSDALEEFIFPNGNKYFIKLLLLKLRLLSLEGNDWMMIKGFDPKVINGKINNRAFLERAFEINPSLLIVDENKEISFDDIWNKSRNDFKIVFDLLDRKFNEK